MALEQFRVLNYQLFSINFSNDFLMVIIILIFSLLIFYMTNLKNLMFLTKSFVQVIFENLYSFVLDVLKQNVGLKGIIYFPIMFNVFFYIYIINISGLVGYNLQLTSHIFVTFAQSISLFIGIIIIGLYNLKQHF
jgi:F-type H+-transporting ATPase subunit a